MAAWILVCALATAGIPQMQWPTLREELRKHGISADALPDADRRITSYAVGKTQDWFGIAYYWDGSGIGANELRISTLSHRGGTWVHAIVRPQFGGSAVRMQRARGFIYLDLHASPSAGELLVLTPELRLTRTIAGYSKLVLRDGRVIYGHNMPHFAPVSPESVGVYDPRTSRDARLYPKEPPKRPGPWIDRSIADVEQIAPSRVRMRVREQQVRLGKDQRSTPVGPPRELLVTCELSTPTPTCSAKPAATR